MGKLEDLINDILSAEPDPASGAKKLKPIEERHPEYIIKSYELFVHTIFGKKISVENMDLTKLKEIISEMLSMLEPKERDVIMLRLGLGNGIMRTLEEIGQMFGVTRECIRQIESKSLRKLRHPSRNMNLRNFIESETGEAVY